MAVKRIGIYGGSFNPPHLGHLRAAKAVRDALGLDEVRLIPAGNPPHKELPEDSASPEQRLKDKDKRRAAYHRFYTNMKWGHAQNYHICLDSGKLGIDTCVAILKQLY